jgi:hypothetical protein
MMPSGPRRYTADKRPRTAPAHRRVRRHAPAASRSSKTMPTLSIRRIASPPPSVSCRRSSGRSSAQPVRRSSPFMRCDNERVARTSPRSGFVVTGGPASPEPSRWPLRAGAHDEATATGAQGHLSTRWGDSRCSSTIAPRHVSTIGTVTVKPCSLRSWMRDPALVDQRRDGPARSEGRGPRLVEVSFRTSGVRAYGCFRWHHGAGGKR